MSEIGHNKPPVYDKEKYDALKVKLAEMRTAAQGWLDGGAIETDEQSSMLADFINGAKKFKSKVDAERKSEKQPYLSASKEVDAAFKIIIDKSDISINGCTDLQTAYLSAKRKKQQEAERKARKEAEELAKQAALEETRAELTGNLDTVDSAQEAFEKAEQARIKSEALSKLKVQAQSFTGGGRVQSLRIQKVVGEITDMVSLFKRYRDHPKLAELFTDLANAELRAKDKPDHIDGITITELEKAA